MKPTALTMRLDTEDLKFECIIISVTVHDAKGYTPARCSDQVAYDAHRGLQDLVDDEQDRGKV